MATAIPVLEGIEVVFRLPYRLVLPEGEYSTSPRRPPLQIAHPEVLDYTFADETGQLDCTGRSVVRMFHEVSLTVDTFDPELKRCIGITLSATNHFIQWYRFHTRHARAIEVVREQVSPILLNLFRGEERQTRVHQYYQPPRLPQPLTSEQLHRLNLDLSQRTGPQTEHLLLLDAQEALEQFRYREVVLLAWIAIETCLAPFLRVKLLESLSDLSFDRDSAGANFEQDLHFLTRADALLQLLTGFSFRTGITSAFWDQLRTSRGHRNDVVHRGGDANEPQARLAVEVAQVFVDQMDGLRGFLPV